MNIKELENLNKKIELLKNTQHIEILRIIHNYNNDNNNTVKLTENKNGIFINMNELDKSILDKIQDYLNYIETKEEELSHVENQKDILSQSLNENS